MNILAIEPARVPDTHIFFKKGPRDLVIEISCHVRPDVVIMLSPHDYILDHEFTSMIVRDAATNASAPNFCVGASNPAPLIKTIPHLYYCAPIHWMDVFGDPIDSPTYVDIGSTIESKEKILACHAASENGFRFVLAWSRDHAPLGTLDRRAARSRLRRRVSPTTRPAIPLGQFVGKIVGRKISADQYKER
ncbi:MAG: hypothetical protein IT331_22555 [Anaerolineae bacterium]|nr:hypothetical protein [Anaerolineae bacterium]